MELATGFIEAHANGFNIITRPHYYDLAVSIAEKDPESYLAEAGATTRDPEQPMSGRGRIAELPGSEGETLILKKRRRGGLYGKLKGDICKSEYEAVSELYISESAWKKGVPVALLGFVMTRPSEEKKGWWRGYSASIKVAGARTLMECLADPPGPTRRAAIDVAGHAVSRAHACGFNHHDLNMGNILIVKSEAGEWGGWLIDLAGSTLGGALPKKARLDNLMRLYRSAEKWLAPKTDAGARQRFRDIVRFLHAYTKGDRKEMRACIEAAEKRRTSLFFHRLGWRMRGVGPRA